jgi:hypothetical protein
MDNITGNDKKFVIFPPLNAHPSGVYAKTVPAKMTAENK